MSTRSKPVESGHNKSRLEHVLLAGLAQVPVGVEATFSAGRREWTVTLKLLSTNPEKGYGYIKLKFGKPVVKSVFLYQLSKIGAAVVEPGEKPVDITDPDSDDWPNDVYFMNIPSAAGESNFDSIMIAKVRKVASMMRTKQFGMIPENKVDGWVVFTVKE